MFNQCRNWPIFSTTAAISTQTLIHNSVKVKLEITLTDVVSTTTKKIKPRPVKVQTTRNHFHSNCLSNVEVVKLITQQRV